MERGLEMVQEKLDKFSNFVANIVAWFTVLMVVITLTVVVLRYGFNIGWIALQESVIYLHACVFMMGAAQTLKTDGHVRVDIFYRKMTPRNKALVDLLGGLFLLFPVVTFVGVMSLSYVVDSWSILEGSPETGGLPAVFLLKSLLLVFVAFLWLQGVAEIIRNALKFKQHSNEEA